MHTHRLVFPFPAHLPELSTYGHGFRPYPCSSTPAPYPLWSITSFSVSTLHDVHSTQRPGIKSIHQYNAHPHSRLVLYALPSRAVNHRSKRLGDCNTLSMLRYARSLFPMPAHRLYPHACHGKTTSTKDNHRPKPCLSPTPSTLAEEMCEPSRLTNHWLNSRRYCTTLHYAALRDNAMGSPRLHMTSNHARTLHAYSYASSLHGELPIG
ncbi:hypothetical protein BU24DRAFT_123413 [Aaosphaeria arxii CBS 175.79]|uniref:Uncharacterized protein n=1 Tax=Aaosphaeria arxii CBS 175.79 TaxID=1450172 RepID=A0A6A5Y2Z4_9PLEO|nr:uncharacterized protein BU24DRAFT_123413 [Aaosphaeria arxii CBS 175.79]KAF2019606.1 hypothetical protein BU24DRAFT_123413 [Aaosphaeria arxii CBS 175.79]